MKIKYWLKLNIMENTTDGYLSKCTHIGEAKIFDYILHTFNPMDFRWTYDKYKEDVIKKKLGVTQATIFTYLKLLCKSGLLKKVSKGIYEVDTTYFHYGSKKEKINKTTKK